MCVHPLRGGGFPDLADSSFPRNPAKLGSGFNSHPWKLPLAPLVQEKPPVPFGARTLHLPSPCFCLGLLETCVQKHWVLAEEHAGWCFLPAQGCLLLLLLFAHLLTEVPPVPSPFAQTIPLATFP